MNLFVDSSAWVALFDASDKFHLRASQALQQLTNTPVSLFTSDYIFDEATTLLMSRSDHKTAVQFGDWLLAATSIKMIFIDETTWQDAWNMFQTYDDKEWAFTDCTSFVLMRQFNLWQAFAFDHQFQQAGFQLWPGLPD